MDLHWYILVALGLVAFAAGLVDSIAGGGGLLTMPALLWTGLPTNLALGSNKGQSVFGSGMALLRYAHSPLLDRRRAMVAVLPGLAGATLGVYLLMNVSSKALTPLVMAMLTGVAIFMIFYRPPHSRPPLAKDRLWAALPIAFLIAAYDGFFGPGTGTFLILAYALVFHDPLDAASANAKVVNFASNLASMVIFAANGLIVWKVALPMAAGQASGAWVGAHLTIRNGRAFVRYVVLVISLALITRLAWQMWYGG